MEEIKESALELKASQGRNGPKLSSNSAPLKDEGMDQRAQLIEVDDESVSIFCLNLSE
jgi:hypothetical protein